MLSQNQSWNRSGRTGQDRTKPDFFRFFCRIFVSMTSKMNRTDFNRTGPDGKNPSGSNSAHNELFIIFSTNHDVKNLKNKVIDDKLSCFIFTSA